MNAVVLGTFNMERGVRMTEKNSSTMSKGLLFLMSTAVSATAANLYFNQPILPQIGADLGISGDALGAIPAASQFGYALALLLISPLGDNMPRRYLITLLSVLLVGASLLAFSANNLSMLVVACFVIGISANITQQLLPFAASLSTPENRGHVIGVLMTGLTLGIVLSRTLSGYVGDTFGWRAVFIMSALLAAVFGILLHLFLPNNKPANRLPYTRLIATMFTLIKDHASLRRATLIGALWFAAFSALLVTLALHVNKPPFGYNAQQAGMFGLIALVGVVGAKFSAIGIKRVGAPHVISIALVLVAVGFAIAGYYGDSLIALIIGIMLIDFGIFSAQVSNQVLVFAIDPEAQSRINGVYMLGYYLGGAVGSLLGVKVFDHFGWSGVALLSISFIVLSFIINNKKADIDATLAPKKSADDAPLDD